MSSSTPRNVQLSNNGDTAYVLLRERLAAGEYVPGERLTESSLARDLGMSRTPVREAIHRLQAAGLLVAAGRGVAVAPLFPEDFADFYRLRAALESLAAELAASRQRDGMLSQVQIDTLQHHLEAVESAVEERNSEATVRTNLAMHKAIATLAGNRFLEEALQRIWDRIAIWTVTNPSDRIWSERTLKQHRAIVLAIRSGAPAAAGEAAGQHILDAIDVVASSFPGSAEFVGR